MDSHSTRKHQPTIIIFQQYNIHVFVLPAHSSATMQPLDLTCHGELKRLLRLNFLIVNGEKKGTTRNRLLFTAVECLQLALSGMYIKKGFTRASIYPYSREAPLKSNLVKDPNGEINFQPPAQQTRAIKFAGKLLTGTPDSLFPQVAQPSNPTLPSTPIIPILAPLNSSHQITPPPIPHVGIINFVKL